MDPEWFREDFGTLIELLRRGEIHPVVAERLPLAEARHAHELLESSAAKGTRARGPRPKRRSRARDVVLVEEPPP
jgi:NADPH:quinone reductase